MVFLIALDCEKSLFCSKIREEEPEEKRNGRIKQSRACERDMQSHEPQVNSSK